MITITPFCHSRSSLFFSSRLRVIAPTINKFTRASSLSAIHRGLRKSERARPQGYKPRHNADSHDGGEGRHLNSPEKRREIPDIPRPEFRIRKGKKDISEPPPPARKSRRARFNDPNDSFGKRSLVYQLKSGRLRAKLEEEASKEKLENGEALRTRRWEERFSSKHAPESESRRESGSHPSKTTSRISGGGRVRPGPATMRRSGASEAPFKRGERSPPESSGRLRRPVEPEASIPYTTAASQFLYGTSVVEAALKASRRRLYNLYIYGGTNRQNVSHDKAIKKLAEKRGIRTTTLCEQDQKLMSKMSQGRPHNGYILEASPIPELPVTALGPLSENAANPGFRVSLGHQSAEEAAINGTGDFIPTSARSKYKPLVLVLDHILDPGNLGAILRSASFLGVSAVAVSKKNSATLTAVALKASAGACETIPLLSIDSTASFLVESKEAGWKVYAAVASHSGSARRNHVDIHDVEELDPLSSDPCILLVGSEGEGLPRMLKSKADFEVNIPNESGSLTVDSLNVSVATGLLCSAFMRGRTMASEMRPKRVPLRSGELGIW